MKSTDYPKTKFIKEMIEEYAGNLMSEAKIIDLVIDHMLDTMTKAERIRIYKYLDNTRPHSHGNWYWLIRRIRNTGAANRLF